VWFQIPFSSCFEAEDLRASYSNSFAFAEVQHFKVLETDSVVSDFQALYGRWLSEASGDGNPSLADRPIHSMAISWDNLTDLYSALLRWVMHIIYIRLIYCIYYIIIYNNNVYIIWYIFRLSIYYQFLINLYHTISLFTVSTLVADISCYVHISRNYPYICSMVLVHFPRWLGDFLWQMLVSNSSTMMHHGACGWCGFFRLKPELVEPRSKPSCSFVVRERQ
jgi:hypothetical protein